MATFWESSLYVITVLEDNHEYMTPQTNSNAKKFLDKYHVPAQFKETMGDPAEIILNTAQDQCCDLILLGGYDSSAKNRQKEYVLNDVLNKSSQAILICR